MTHGANCRVIVQNHNVHGVVAEVARRADSALVLCGLVLVGAVGAAYRLAGAPRTVVTDRAGVRDRCRRVLSAWAVVTLSAVASR